MDTFSISDLQQFSGIKAHTIRMWEQRYNALTPKRSDGNTRSYDNTQLRRLLNIVSLMNQEHKVSELCSMPDKEIYKLIETKINNEIGNFEHYEHFISQMVLTAMNFNEVHFEKLFSGCLLRFGLKDTYIQVLYPVLNRLGMMWSINSIPPAQEHFITNLIRQKILTATDSLPLTDATARTWLLFLPENEFHEIGLMFAQWLLKYHGNRVIYLGANVPIDSLENAVINTKPTDIYCFMVHHNLPEGIESYLKEIAKKFKHYNIHISVNEHLRKNIKTGKEIHFIDNVESLIQTVQI